MWSDDAVVLLGAGASADAGIPTSFKMTREIASTIADDPKHAREAWALNYVCAALLAHDAAETGASPFGGIDVERVFAAVQMLASRQDLNEVTPFIGSWHPAIDELDLADENPELFDRLLGQAVHFVTALDKPAVGAHFAISQLIDQRTGRAVGGTTFRKLAELMLRELRQLVATTPKKVGYLSPLVNQGRRPGGITIATLNYDRSIELAGADAGVQVSTGIDSWLSTGILNWSDADVRLLKLHGSIDWSWHREEPVSMEERTTRDLPLDILVVSEEPDEADRPGVIFGQGAKLRAEGPFLTLLVEFERQLAAADQLIVIGYSFRDEHVNEVIRRWIADRASRVLLVVDPAWPFRRYTYLSAPPMKPEDSDFRGQLAYYLMGSVTRGETLFGNHPPADRLEIQQQTCAQALATLHRE